MPNKSGVIAWYRPDKMFGAIQGDDGVVYGFHLNQLGSFGPAEDNGYVIELFHGGKCESVPTPKKGDRVAFIDNERVVDGKHRIELFAFEAEALELQRKQKELEEFLAAQKTKKRLETNPLFRVVETEFYYGDRTSKPEMYIFEGTAAEFRRRMNSGRPIPIEPSKPVAGFQYRRRFVKQTAAGWQDSLDPREIRFSPAIPALEDAKFILSRSVRTPDGWTSKAWNWNNTGRRLAFSYEGIVSFPDSEWFDHAEFRGCEGEMLSKLGLR